MQIAIYIHIKYYSLSKYPSGQICKQTAKSVTYRCAGAQVRQLSWPAPAQVSHDSWQGQQTPPWLGKLRGGHRLTQVLQSRKLPLAVKNGRAAGHKIGTHLSNR